MSLAQVREGERQRPRTYLHVGEIQWGLLSSPGQLRGWSVLGQVAACGVTHPATPFFPGFSTRYPAATTGLSLGGGLAFLQTASSPVASLLRGPGVGPHTCPS